MRCCAGSVQYRSNPDPTRETCHAGHAAYTAPTWQHELATYGRPYRSYPNAPDHHQAGIDDLSVICPRRELFSDSSQLQPTFRVVCTIYQVHFARLCSVGYIQNYTRGLYPGGTLQRYPPKNFSKFFTYPGLQ